MNLEYIQNAHKTDNAQLWSHCYWGTGGSACEEVIHNRNVFADKWKGIKYYKSHIMLKKQHHNNEGEWGIDVKMARARKKHYPWFDAKYGNDKGIHFNSQYLDHSEYYILPDKRKMILFHPYHIEDEALDYVIKNGFVMIPELYAMGAYSFLKIV